MQLPQYFHIHRNGVLVQFCQPLSRAFVEKPGNHFAQCWNYRYSSGYGSREFSPSHYGTPGHDSLSIASATLLTDGRSLFLEIPELQPVNQLHLHIGIEPGRSTDLFATVHKLDGPFRELSGYRETPKTIAAHPILRDIAFAAKQTPNPWRKPIAKAREIQVDAGKNLTFAPASLRVKPGEPLRFTFKNPDVVPHNWVLIKIMRRDDDEIEELVTTEGRAPEWWALLVLWLFQWDCPFKASLGSCRASSLRSHSDGNVRTMRKPSTSNSSEGRSLTRMAQRTRNAWSMKPLPRITRYSRSETKSRPSTSWVNSSVG